MTDSVLQPSYWRQRAKETREAAKDISNADNRKILEDVAESYEEMGDLMEKRERGPVRVSPTSPADIDVPKDLYSPNRAGSR